MRQALRLAAAAAPIALAALFAACGGGGDDAATPTPTQAPTATPDPAAQAYFAAVKAAIDQTHADREALNTRLAAGLSPDRTDDERGAAIAAYADDNVATAQASQERFAGISPPAGVQAVHNKLVSAADQGVSLANLLKSSISDNPISSDVEFTTLYFDTGGTTIEQRFRDACFDLQSFADASGATVDFECTR